MKPYEAKQWPLADEEKLRTLWIKGLTAKEISAEFKMRYSRSAILGKVRRLNLVVRKEHTPKYAMNPWRS